MPEETTGKLDYEAEYHKLLEETQVLMDKLDYVIHENKMKDEALTRMRAQLDIVYLIFGGGNRG